MDAALSFFFVCDTGSGDVRVDNPKAFSHSQCLPLKVSHLPMCLPFGNCEILGTIM